MKRKIEICIIIIMLILIIYFIYQNSNSLDSENKTTSNTSSTEFENLKEVEIKEINELKTQLGITGETDLYTIVEEYDGRKTLTIRPDLQYNVVMAGILNENILPEYSNINQILKDEPKDNGIWISNKSRDKILEILKLITNVEYTINEKGYLQQQTMQEMNQYDEMINKILRSNKLYVIDINTTCYILDNVTGKIVENRFEEVDPYIPFEYFEMKNKSVFIITTNSKKKLNHEKILKEILENINL